MIQTEITMRKKEKENGNKEKDIMREKRKLRRETKDVHSRGL